MKTVPIKGNLGRVLREIWDLKAREGTIYNLERIPSDHTVGYHSACNDIILAIRTLDGKGR